MVDHFRVTPEVLQDSCTLSQAPFPGIGVHLIRDSTRAAVPSQDDNLTDESRATLMHSRHISQFSRTVSHFGVCYAFLAVVL